jgi:predicted acyltransferase
MQSSEKRAMKPTRSPKENTRSRVAAAGESGRLMSLDALRGFDMFWIVGAGSLVHALSKMGENSVTKFLSTQLEHADWEGFHFYDLIFPMFVFIAGVSMTFSMDKALARQGQRGALTRLARRCVLLVLLGLFYYGGLSTPWPDIRLTGVLQTFGVACFLAGSIYLFWPRNPRAIAAAFLAFMASYWLLMSFVPFPDLHLKKEIVAELAAKVGSKDPAALARSVAGRVHGVFEEDRNLANYVDFRFLPGKKQYGDGFWEAQGLLKMVMATSSCLLGMLAGLWLRRKTEKEEQKVLVLVGAGVLSVALGFGLGHFFPVVKKLWSPTFVLVAGGYSAMLLALFFYLVDIRKWQRWCMPFVWIGMNPITIYLAYNIVKFDTVAARFAGGDVQSFLDWHITQGAGGLFLALVEIALMFLLVRFLYVRKIFIRL